MEIEFASSGLRKLCEESRLMNRKFGADEPVPVNEDGSIAWERVDRIRVVFIGDYHD